ncbi:HEPN/Toprim-associated domain-containing protein [Kitasatospora azatica]|uniref:HEPN/Toprim-associated domain-containing protein n=1 Tax=Kitasatospora azatica TaxID=58347 RepID=UPI000561E673|nr:HEPN/Toprim-associated domain-containing protein [Kitasatospora azatica]
MSDRWFFFLGEDEISSGKNHTPTKLMTIFQEHDKYMDGRWASEVDAANAGDFNLDADAADWIEAPSEAYEGAPGSKEYAGGIEDGDMSTAFGYSATVGTVVKRLSLMGFTSQRCQAEMAEFLRELHMIDGEDALYVPVSGTPEGEHLPIAWEDVVGIGLRALIASSKRSDEQEPRENFMTACLEQLEAFREFDADLRILLAALLQGQAPDTVVRLDLHDLLAAGYFNRHDAVSELAQQELATEMASSGPIIVMTEGTTDARFLKRGLQIVAPELAGYFTFLDPDAKAAGGAPELVKSLRAFAAAGIMNRVVALVDNDAAGRQAVKTLSGAPLPDRFRVRLLPDLDYVKDYPTLGPTGDTRYNINGRACSVEFYFGLDCLRAASGEPLPVRWTGFNGAINDYQGELVPGDKKTVQDRIDKMLTAAEEGGTPLDDRWDAMRKIAQTLIAAAGR